MYRRVNPGQPTTTGKIVAVYRTAAHALSNWATLDLSLLAPGALGSRSRPSELGFGSESPADVSGIDLGFAVRDSIDRETGVL